MQEKVSDTKSSPQGAPKGDLDPHWSWGRHLPAWGAMGVDFESRVEFDRMRRIDGDWVIRSGASEDDLVQSAFTIVRREMNWPVIVQKKKVEREVFVARGTWKLTSPRPTPGEPPLLRIYLDKPGKIDNHAAGDVHELFTTLGEIMETEVVNEAQGTEKQSVFWCNNASGGVAAEFRAKLLAHITEQTGLTFTLERRKMDTWVTQQE